MRRLIILVGSIFVCLSNALAQDETSPWYERYDLISYTELRKLIDSGEIEEARLLDDGWWVTVKTNNGDYFDSRVTPQTPIVDHFYDAEIPVRIEHKKSDSSDERPLWLELLINLSPLLIFIFFFVFILGFSQRRGKKTQDECLDRAQAINNEFLEKQEQQFTKFIEALSSAMNGRTNG